MPPIAWLVPLAIVVAVPLETPDEWRLHSRQDGIDVFTAEAPDAPWGRADGLVAAPPEALIEHLTAFEALTAHVPRLAEVRVIRREAGEAVAYFRFDLPWPIADRDYTARYRWSTESDGRTRMVIDDAESEGPPPGRAVRVRRLAGEFLLTPESAGATHVRFTTHADYGGRLPRFIKQGIAWKQPLQTLLGIRRAVAPR